MRHGLRRRRQWLRGVAPGDGTAYGTEVDVGGSLRNLREKQKLTIRALAYQSGLAVNTLSLIENGKSSASVYTLQQLALAIDVPITDFLKLTHRKVKSHMSRRTTDCA